MNPPPERGRPKVLAYDASHAVVRVQGLVLCVVADPLEHDEAGREFLNNRGVTKGPGRRRTSRWR